MLQIALHIARQDAEYNYSFGASAISEAKMPEIKRAAKMVSVYS